MFGVDRTMTILRLVDALRGFAEDPHHGQIQLLLGNMGMAAGINGLRGHANVQGITDMCLFGDSLPGLHAFADRRRGHAGCLPRQAHTRMPSGADELLSNYSSSSSA